VQNSDIAAERGPAGRGGPVRPKLVFAYRKALTENVFSAGHLSTLGQVCDILDPEPLESFDSERARRLLAEAEILVTAWGCPKLDPAFVSLAPRLRLIAHAAGTVKNFIAAEVFAAGVAVCNAASANALPVAEFTLAAILFSNKRVLHYRDSYRDKRAAVRWEDLSSPQVGNWRKTIGIVGCSRIGRRVIELLRPFDFTVIAYDPYLSAVDAASLGVAPVGLDDLLARSDVVSIHAPALEATRHMIDAGRLALMREGATLINTSRGSLIDQAALIAELETGRINAVLDVTTPDPLPADSPLYDLPNVLLTPHVAGALGGERERLGALVVAEVERFAAGQPLAHAIAVNTLHLQA
jgi:phosphoglycerate dehydrogenase-like enzyme